MAKSMRKITGAPDPIDVYVGRRIRLRRIELGQSQSWLADGLQVSFQQVQKYERGTNRISASKLHASAGVLKVPITYFFAGIEDPAEPRGAEYAEAFAVTVEELLAAPNGPALAEAFLRIKRRGLQKALVDLARAIAAEDEARGITMTPEAVG
jgi:transcriptional regulator with XRE-family HTH domain